MTLEVSEKPEISATKLAYRKAFADYVDSPSEPSLSSIAIKYRIHPETLQAFATRRNWIQHRLKAASDRSLLEQGMRANIAAQTDAFLARKVSTWIEQIAELQDRFLTHIAALPLDGQDDREKRFNLRQGIELTNEALKGVSTLVETGRSIGLVIGPQKALGADAKPPDLAKLTALNTILRAAMDGAAANAVAEKQAGALTVESGPPERKPSEPAAPTVESEPE